MVGLTTSFLLFNTLFSFSLHYSSKTLAIYFESAKTGVESDFLTVLVQSISGRLPERGRKKRNDNREKKKSKQLPPTPTASAVGPCPTNNAKK